MHEINIYYFNKVDSLKNIALNSIYEKNYNKMKTYEKRT